uniref:Uncharacterized protein n=1 Tax=Micrurus corallinus TaxID=54390 RepID=A0A2D4F412_MICCO
MTVQSYDSLGKGDVHKVRTIASHIPHSHLIAIWALGNQLILKMVVESCNLCDLPSQLPTSKVHWELCIKNGHKNESGHMITHLMTESFHNQNSSLNCCKLRTTRVHNVLVSTTSMAGITTLRHSQSPWAFGTE